MVLQQWWDELENKIHTLRRRAAREIDRTRWKEAEEMRDDKVRDEDEEGVRVRGKQRTELK